MPDRDHIEIPDGRELREKLLRHQTIPPVRRVVIPTELGGPDDAGEAFVRMVPNRKDRRRRRRSK